MNVIQELFLKLAAMGIAASWMIAAVLLLRSLFRRAPKWIICLLWALAGLRLVCPVSVESPISLLPSPGQAPLAVGERDAAGEGSRVLYVGAIRQELPESPGKSPAGIAGTKKGKTAGAADAAKGGTVDGANNKKTESAAASGTSMADSTGESPGTGNGGEKGTTILSVITVIWITGVAAMLLYLAGSYICIRRRVATATFLRDNIWESEFVDSPFILGLAQPRIYIPYQMGESQLAFILAHERAHLKRKDHIGKVVAFLILSVYWFHPLVWLSYALFCRDIELACDEKVVRNMDAKERKGYLYTLLSCGTGRMHTYVCPLAFGEVGIRERVVRVKKYKKPSIALTILTILAGVSLSACLMTNPKEPGAGKTVAVTPGAAAAQPEKIEPADAGTELATTYKMKMSEGEFLTVPTLNLDTENKTFVFSYDLLSSYMPVGTYTEEGNRIVCATDDNNCHYTFERGENNTLVFLASLSSATTMTDGVWGEIKDGAVFEPSAEALPDKMSGEIIETRPAQVDLSASAGADGAQLYYADERKIIFGGYFGLFVHDKKTGQITRSLDLSYIACNMTQGDHYCEIAASKDGERIYLKPKSEKKLYTFDLPSGILTVKTYKKSTFWEDKSLDLCRVKDSYICYQKGKEKYTCSLVWPGCNEIGRLAYEDSRLGAKRAEEEKWSRYPLFPPEGQKEKLPSFAPEDIHDIVRVSIRLHGEMQEVTDTNLCKKLESCLSVDQLEEEMGGGSACPFWDAVYITRADGVTGIIWPAEDGCDVIMSDKGYYDMGKKFKEMFWDILDDWYQEIIHTH